MPSMHLSTLPKWFLQSPPAEWTIMQLRSLLIGALRQGPIPKHIAFVMDGNRRFARNHGIETVEGHHLGFEALARVLEVCYKSGVQVVTVYAFSIENFKRSKYEVDALMDLAKVKLAQLSQHGDLLERYGARVRVLGQRSLLKDDVLEAVDKAVELTKHNQDAVLNICFPYTSQDEMTTAIRETVAEYSNPRSSTQSNRHQRHRSFSETHIVYNIQARRLSTSSAVDSEASPPLLKVTRSQSPNSSTAASDTEDSFSSSTTTLYPDSPFPEDISPKGAQIDGHPNKHLGAAIAATPEIFPDPEMITPSVLTSHMFTADLPPLDLLIRTSGVERLSDFMLWQCHQDTEIVFLKCLWPDFDLWTFLPVLIEWQWKRRKGFLKSAKGTGDDEKGFGDAGVKIKVG